MVKIAYSTNFGICYCGDIEEAIRLKKIEKYKGKINLIFTSPPFPLNRKKKYGNLDGDKYKDWLTSITTRLGEFLTPDGSLVIEIGNAWNSGEPTISTLPLETLLEIAKRGEYKICQQFIWYNTAKLPSPAQWVNVERNRVKDSFTNIWWFSKIAKPKANNRYILQEYSESMKKLIRTQKYNPGKRPSEHVINAKTFLLDNSGSIPSNVIVGSNSSSNSEYIRYCKKENIELHPARMPNYIPDLFIKFLTVENDIVFDPFGGSNTTGQSAETLSRRWIAVEQNLDYVKGSIGRFKGVKVNV